MHRSISVEVRLFSKEEKSGLQRKHNFSEEIHAIINIITLVFMYTVLRIYILIQKANVNFTMNNIIYDNISTILFTGLYYWYIYHII